MHLVHATNYLGEDIHSRVVVHGNVDATEEGLTRLSLRSKMKE